MNNALWCNNCWHCAACGYGARFVGEECDEELSRMREKFEALVKACGELHNYGALTVHMNKFDVALSDARKLLGVPERSE